MTRAVLAVLIALAFFLRVHDIGTDPPELFEDEISGAMSAWSVVTTGHDVIADHLPLFTTRLGPQLPLYGLSTVPFQAVLGHTALAVRIPAVLLGTALVPLLYLLLLRLTDRRVALLGAALIAVLPWAVHFGRVGWDNASYPALLIAGCVLLLDTLRRGSGRRLVGAAVVLALSAYTYQVAILETPLFAAALCWPLRSKLRALGASRIAPAVAAAGVVVAPYIWLTLTVPLFTERSRSISTFAQGVNGDALATFVRNYLAELSPVFLFVSGDENLRHGTGRGELLLWMLPFAVVGVAWCITHARRDALAFIAIAWLALAPLPAAITDDGVPHAARSMLELIAWPIIVALGMTAIWRALAARHRPYVFAAVAILALVETTSYYRDMYATYPVRSAAAWQSGTAEAMADVRRLTPAGGTACIDTLSSFTFPHLARWYLEGVPFRVIERDDTQCGATGDVLVLEADAAAPAGAREAARVVGLDGATVARVWQRR